MKASFTQKDAVTPALRKLIRKLDDNGRREALEVMGMVIRDWAVESFTDETKRVRPWVDKVDGTPATLQKTHALIRSYRVEPTPRVVVIASDRPYALAHQLGTTNLPDRPMLPVDDAGELIPQAKEDAQSALWDYLNS